MRGIKDALKRQKSVSPNKVVAHTWLTDGLNIFGVRKIPVKCSSRSNATTITATATTTTFTWSEAVTGFTVSDITTSASV